MIGLLLSLTVSSWAFFATIENATNEIVAVSDIQISSSGYTSFQVSTTTVKQMFETEGIKGLAIVLDVANKKYSLTKAVEEIQRKLIQKEIK